MKDFESIVQQKFWPNLNTANCHYWKNTGLYGSFGEELQNIKYKRNAFNPLYVY